MREAHLQRTSITQDDWIRGPPQATMTLLEYGDFQCPYCGVAEPEILAALAASRGRVRLVYRHFPIASLHPFAQGAAEAAEAAGAQGRFWEMHDRLYAHQRSLTLPDLLDHGRALGLDVAVIERDLADHVYQPQVHSDFRSGVLDGVNGTPTLFIQGARYDGPRDRESLVDAFAEMEERGELTPA